MPLTRSERNWPSTPSANGSSGPKRWSSPTIAGYPWRSWASWRRDLRAKGAEYHVVKNTLTRRALADAGMSAPDGLLAGPLGLAFLFDDLSGPARC